MRALWLLFFAASVSAQEPLAFKDLRLGQPFSDAGLVGNKLICGHDRRMGDFCKLSPTAHETIAGVEAFVTITLVDGNVESIYVGFKEAGFLDVRNALREKYPELRCKRSTVQNRMGATFDQEECELTRPNGDRLSLRQRGSNLDRGSLSIDSPKADADYAKRSAAGKKDL